MSRDYQGAGALGAQAVGDRVGEESGGAVRPLRLHLIDRIALIRILEKIIRHRLFGGLGALAGGLEELEGEGS